MQLLQNPFINTPSHRASPSGCHSFISSNRRGTLLGTNSSSSSSSGSSTTMLLLGNSRHQSSFTARGISHRSSSSSSSTRAHGLVLGSNRRCHAALSSLSPSSNLRNHRTCKAVNGPAAAATNDDTAVNGFDPSSHTTANGSVSAGASNGSRNGRYGQHATASVDPDAIAAMMHQVRSSACHSVCLASRLSLCRFKG